MSMHAAYRQDPFSATRRPVNKDYQGRHVAPRKAGFFRRGVQTALGTVVLGAFVLTAALLR